MNADEIFGAAVRLPHDQRNAYVTAACGGDERLRAQVRERFAAVGGRLRATVRRRTQIAGACAALSLLLAAALADSVLQTRKAEAAARRAGERAREAEASASMDRWAAKQSSLDAAEAAAQWKQRLAEAERAVARNAELESQALKRLNVLERAQDATAELFAALGDATYDKPEASIRDLLLKRIVILAQRLDAVDASQTGQLAPLQRSLGIALVGLGDLANSLPLLETQGGAEASSMLDESADEASLQLWRMRASSTVGNRAADLPVMSQILRALRPDFESDASENLEEEGGSESNAFAMDWEDAETPSLEAAVVGHVERGELEAAAGVAVTLGQALMREGRTQEGIAVLEEAVKYLRSKQGFHSVDVHASTAVLMDAYLRSGCIDRALFTKRLMWVTAFAPHGAHTHVKQTLASQCAGLATTLSLVALNWPCAPFTLDWQTAPQHSQPLKEIAASMRAAEQAHAAGAPEIALLLMRQAYVACWVAFGPEFPLTRNVSMSLARWHLEQARLDLALPAIHAVFRQLGRDREGAARFIGSLFATLAQVANDPASLPALERAQRQAVSEFAADHDWPLALTANLATCYRVRGDVAAEVALKEEYATFLRRRLGTVHATPYLQQLVLAEAYNRVGRLSEAFAVAEPACRQTLAFYDFTDEQTLWSLELLYPLAQELGVAHRLAGDLQRASQARLVDARLRLKYSALLAQTYARIGEADQARSLAADTLARGRQTFPAYTDEFALFLARLGDALVAAGEPAEGVELLKECLRVCELSPHPGRLPWIAKITLGEAFLRQNKPEEAERWFTKGFSVLRRDPLNCDAWSIERMRTACRRLVELASERGDQIRATHWREAWNALHPKGTVGPAGTPRPTR